MINAKITGVGGYVPEKVYDNAYMESIVDTNDEWITRRTGIKERHISADNEYTTDMATIAAKRAIENAGLTPEDIDLIMLATVTPDYFTPACACIVQSNLGAVNAAAFDYNAACSGFVTGLTIAELFIKAGTYKHIVVVCADTLSKATDYKTEQLAYCSATRQVRQLYLQVKNKVLSQQTSVQTAQAVTL